MDTEDLQLVRLAEQPRPVLTQAARLLVEGFSAPSGWADMKAARAEVRDLLKEGFAFGLLDGETLAGWIGGLPQYDGLVWELHPLVVRQAYRRRGVGRRLVAAFEDEARRRGGLTATLGTDDDAGMTSLAGVNLYQDLPGQIATVRDLGRGHPFLFYLAQGYTITGVMPDANGVGLPDIYMSKSLRTTP